MYWIRIKKIGFFECFSYCKSSLRSMIVRNSWAYMMNYVTRTNIMVKKIDNLTIRPINGRKAPLIKENSELERCGTSESVW